MSRAFLLLYLFSFSFVAVSCVNRKHFDESVETMNKGEITVYADETYHELADELVQSYENVYPEAHITMEYATEKNVLEAMMSGKARMMITGKKLTEGEKSAIAKVNGFEPRISTIAYEAIAVITSAASPDTSFDFDAFLTTRNSTSNVNTNKSKYVFVRGQTSFVNQVTRGEPLNFSDLFSLGTSDSLINYVSSTPDSYGFISFAILSDADDPKVKELLGKIRILPIAMTDSAGIKKSFELSQSTIATSEYPLLREIDVVKGNMTQTLGTGFVNFMYRSKASKIFLKAGLIPVVMPERQFKIVE